MFKLLWLGLMCLVLSVACANSPTPTPLPPAIGYMLGTPYPTDTPRPPTRTPGSASITNARATIVAINRALPAPASTPTPTPRPTLRDWNSNITVVTRTPSTPEPWVRYQPKPYYSIETPRIWQMTVEEQGFVTLQEPRAKASVTIIDFYSEFGWADDTIDDMVQEDMTNSDLTPGFKLIKVEEVGTARVVTYYITGDPSYCGTTGYSKFILTKIRYFIVNVEVCDSSKDKFDRQFASRMLDSFVYEEE